VHNSARPLKDAIAVFGHPTIRSIDQDYAKFSLQSGDMAGDVGLHRVKRAGGGAETPVVSYRDEGGQLPEIHL
jgi:hypothetical protein